MGRGTASQSIYGAAPVGRCAAVAPRGLAPPAACAAPPRVSSSSLPCAAGRPMPPAPSLHSAPRAAMPPPVPPPSFAAAAVSVSLHCPAGYPPAPLRCRTPCRTPCDTDATAAALRRVAGLHRRRQRRDYLSESGRSVSMLHRPPTASRLCVAIAVVYAHSAGTSMPVVPARPSKPDSHAHAHTPPTDPHRRPDGYPAPAALRHAHTLSPARARVAHPASSGSLRARARVAPRQTPLLSASSSPAATFFWRQHRPPFDSDKPRHPRRCRSGPPRPSLPRRLVTRPRPVAAVPRVAAPLKGRAAAPAKGRG